MAAELEMTRVLWLLTFRDGFSYAWNVFYAQSQEEAELQAKEMIDQLTSNVTDIKLTSYPRRSHKPC